MSFPAWQGKALQHGLDGDAIFVDVDADTEMAIARAQGRNTIAAAAAQADAVLGCLLGALPIYDATDTDFRAQLRYATRAGVIADILRFGQ